MNREKLNEHFSNVKKWTQGLGGEALAASLIGFESALDSGDKSAVAQNWAAVKRDCVGLVAAEGYLNGETGPTAQDLGRSLEKIDEALAENGEKAPDKSEV